MFFFVFKDRLLNTYNRLQSDSHFRRRKNLEELHEKYVEFTNNDCYSSLIQVFHDYNEWIEQRSQLIQQFQSIQQSYERQCEDIVNYVEMIDDLRTVVYKNIRKISESSSSPPPMVSANEFLIVPTPASSSAVHSQSHQTAENDSSHQQQQQQISSGEEEIEIDIDNNPPNKTLLKKIRGTTKKTMQQAEEGFLKLDHVIRQLRTNIQKK